MEGEKSKMAAFCLDPGEETARSRSKTFIYLCCFFFLICIPQKFRLSCFLTFNIGPGGIFITWSIVSVQY